MMIRMINLFDDDDFGWDDLTDAHDQEYDFDSSDLSCN